MVNRVKARVMPMKIPWLRVSGLMKFGWGHSFLTSWGACGLTMVRVLRMNWCAVGCKGIFQPRSTKSFNTQSLRQAPPDLEMNGSWGGEVVAARWSTVLLPEALRRSWIGFAGDNPDWRSSRETEDGWESTIPDQYPRRPVRCRHTRGRRRRWAWRG